MDNSVVGSEGINSTELKYSNVQVSRNFLLEMTRWDDPICRKTQTNCLNPLQRFCKNFTTVFNFWQLYSSQSRLPWWESHNRPRQSHARLSWTASEAAEQILCLELWESSTRGSSLHLIQSGAHRRLGGCTTQGGYTRAGHCSCAGAEGCHTPALTSTGHAGVERRSA